MSTRVVLAIPLIVLSAGCKNTGPATQPGPVSLPIAVTPTICCVVSGNVTAAGVPVANALVDVLGTGEPLHFTFTAADGSFRLVVPKGVVVLRAGKWGLKTQLVPIDVGQDIRRDVMLLPGDAPVPLVLDKTISSIVTLEDTICATSDPAVEDGDAGLGLIGPCKAYVVTVPRDGTLVATATWPAKDMYMTVVTALHGTCCSSPRTLRFPVIAGSTIELGVSIHASELLPLGTAAPFELRVALEPAQRP